jgi:hypothetical protein
MEGFAVVTLSATREKSERKKEMSFLFIATR